jgi:hypothetical protein
MIRALGAPLERERAFAAEASHNPAMARPGFGAAIAPNEARRASGRRTQKVKACEAARHATPLEPISPEGWRADRRSDPTPVRRRPSTRKKRGRDRFAAGGMARLAGVRLGN